MPEGGRPKPPRSPFPVNLPLVLIVKEIWNLSIHEQQVPTEICEKPLLALEKYFTPIYLSRSFSKVYLKVEASEYRTKWNFPNRVSGHLNTFEYVRQRRTPPFLFNYKWYFSSIALPAVDEPGYACGPRSDRRAIVGPRQNRMYNSWALAMQYSSGPSVRIWMRSRCRERPERPAGRDVFPWMFNGGVRVTTGGIIVTVFNRPGRGGAGRTTVVGPCVFRVGLPPPDFLPTRDDPNPPVHGSFHWNISVIITTFGPRPIVNERSVDTRVDRGAAKGVEGAGTPARLLICTLNSLLASDEDKSLRWFVHKHRGRDDVVIRKISLVVSLDRNYEFEINNRGSVCMY